MTFPTIHMNGTNPRDLLEDQMRATGSVLQAIHDLENAGPNARDYYPQGPGAFEQAVREHATRVARLVLVRKELEQISEHIAEFA